MELVGGYRDALASGIGSFAGLGKGANGSKTGIESEFTAVTSVFEDWARDILPSSVAPRMLVVRTGEADRRMEG